MSHSTFLPPETQTFACQHIPITFHVHISRTVGARAAEFPEALIPFHLALPRVRLRATVEGTIVND